MFARKIMPVGVAVVARISSRRVCRLLLPVFCVVGCLPSGEDSWGHYTGGGNYPARTPSMSSDGTVIVFSSPRSGRGDIYQVNRDGSAQIRLTTDQSFETDPIYSPDGSMIAFARETNGCRHIWLMNRDGTDQKQLTLGGVLDDIQLFSPDGSEVVISRSPLSIGMGRMIEHFAVNLRTKRTRKLEGLPVYSPDGKTISYSAFNKDSKRYEVWIMAAGGSEKRFLVAGDSPRFSTGGNTILYSTEVKHPGAVWKMIEIDGSNDRQLGNMADPVFAPDGKHIVYLSPSWQRELWKMDIDGTNQTRLVAPVGYIDFLKPCRTGFILKIVTDDRVGDIYLIDTEAWDVKYVAPIK